MSSICLAMIVKNESKVIERCLETVCKIIDYYVISDTGSTDNTIEIIQNFFYKRNIKGEIHEHKWVDFSYNRNNVMKLAKNNGDYTLIIDADEILEYEPDFILPKLELDCYHIITKYGNTAYFRKQLVSNKLDWIWKDVLHEYLDCDELKTAGHLKGICNIPSSDGFRSSNPRKYLDDAIVLEEALIKEPNNTRYYFYLAQSYRDALKYKKAIHYYRERSKMGGWEEEIYYSLYQIGVCKQKINDDSHIKDFVKAFCYRTTRLEALYQIVKHYNKNENYIMAYQYGLLGITVKYPTDILFLEYNVYGYLFLEEVAKAAYKIGKYSESFILYQKIIIEHRCPKNEGMRIMQNMKFSEDRIDTVIKREKIKGQKGAKKIFRNNTLEESNINLFIYCKHKTDDFYISVMNNVNNVYINKIHIFSSEYIDLQNEKIIINKIDKPLIKNMSKYFIDGEINILLNSDFYFDDTLKNLRNINICNNECFILSKWIDNNLDRMARYYHYCYIFKGKINNYDTTLDKLYTKIRYSYLIINPSATIKLHETMKKWEKRDKSDFCKDIVSF